MGRKKGGKNKNKTELVSGLYGTKDGTLIIGKKNKVQIMLDIVKKQEKVEIPLSEESKKLVDKGLQEAKEGKLSPLKPNDLVEKNNIQISQERKDNTVLVR